MKKTTPQKRLSKVARELNVGISTITSFLSSEGYKDKYTPNTKISIDKYELLLKKFGNEKNLKKAQKEARRQEAIKKEAIYKRNLQQKEKDSIEQKEKVIEKKVDIVPETSSNDKFNSKEPKILGKINLEDLKKPNKKKKPKKKDKKRNIEPVTVIDIIKKKKKRKPEKKITEKKKVQPLVVQKTKEETTEQTTKKNIVVTNDVVKKDDTKTKDDIKHNNEQKINISDNKSKKVKETKISETKESDTDKSITKKIEDTKNKIKDTLKVLGKIDLTSLNQRTRPARKTRKEKEAERKKKENEKKKTKEKTTEQKGKSLKVNQIVLDSKKKSRPVAKKRKRKRVEKVEINSVKSTNFKRKPFNKGRSRPKSNIVDPKDIDKQIKETLAKLGKKQKNKAVKYRQTRRAEHKNIREKEKEKQLEQKKEIRITEFVSVNELANIMDIHVNKIIGTCMDLDIPVSINFRLDADTITVLAEEFGFTVDFISTKTEDEELFFIDEDDEKLIARPPIITVMGHVDHGKTSLLDYIRSTNVIAGEAGGITQHIGAYHVTVDTGEIVTFLDTPGHEAFTAMRARGAKVTDVVIVIVAADDSIMPQTIEAIDHSKAANVPIVFAINKIDKENADPERIKRELADRNYLIEEWGGKYGCVEISAKHGKNIDELLERVILESEMLELKANPDRNALGTVVESTLDKGRGYVTTLLLKTGTLKIGDIVLVGQFTGKVKAMFNERGKKVKKAGPSEPILILGLNGAPEAGDPFVVMENEKEAKEKANYRQQLKREIAFRAQKFLTLDEIGRRIQVGDFKELNLVIKGDVIGSIEALSDSISKLSTDEIQVNIIHKAVGQISDNDIMLAVASKAIVVGFQVRPSISSRKLAEKYQIEIRQYSVIFDVINDIRDAMEGMLSPEIKEEVVGTAEILKIFKIVKVGTIAGCMVKDGKLFRTSKIKLIRDGIVKYTGELGSLKRYKDDAKEVLSGQECGLNIERFNDIKVGDFIEAFKEIEVKKTLK